MTKFKFLSLLFFGLAFNFLLTSCEEEKVQTRSMEQIYAEEGVPVRVVDVKKGNFEINLSYNAVLTGIEESNVYAAIGDRVEKINVQIGEYVKKDQILLTFPTDNPSANFFQAKVAYENSKKTLERYENLFKTGGISQQNLDNVRTQFRVDEANWAAVRQAIEVKAPISGYVTRINVRETENVDSKELLMTIANTSKLKATLSVAESDIDFVQKGTKVTALWNGKEVVGEVVSVNLAMDPFSKSFRANLEFPNKSNALRAGVTAKLSIAAATSSDVISVNRKNLVKEDEKYYAFLADGDKAKKVEVEIGKDRGLYLEILSGLNENDKLITEGQMFLDNGTKIKIVK